MWSIVALLVIGIAFMMLTSVQDDIPANIRGLWDRPHDATSVGPDSAGQAGTPLPSNSVSRDGWRVVKEGGNVELSKDLDGAWGTALRYDAPTFVVTCYENRLFARIEARLTTEGARESAVRVDNRLQQWSRSSGNGLYAPDPKGLVQNLQRPRAVAFQLTFSELGERTFQLDSTGLREVSASLAASCLPR